MEERWPTTQQFLLDHLRRIVEGVHQVHAGAHLEAVGDPPDDQWFFGFGNDCLVSCKESQEPEEEDSAAVLASIEMFLSLQGVEARDRPSGPINKKGLQHCYELLGEFFSNPPNSQEFLKRVLPENASTEQLQQAYAFEMLLKLKQVADRSKEKAVQTMLSLENVPEAVDDYMAEAAACFRYGFDKACLSVCRTALEESLKRRMIAKHSIKNKALKTLIKEAHENNYLDDKLVRAAHQIRCWGNNAVHGKILEITPPPPKGGGFDLRLKSPKALASDPGDPLDHLHQLARRPLRRVVEQPTR